MLDFSHTREKKNTKLKDSEKSKQLGFSWF